MKDEPQQTLPQPEVENTNTNITAAKNASSPQELMQELLAQLTCLEVHNNNNSNSPAAVVPPNNDNNNININTNGNPTTTTTTTRDALKKVQKEIQLISALQSALEHRMTVQQSEELGLYRSLSPLLSLDRPLVCHIISYLDEEGLWALEESSPKLVDKSWGTRQWEWLDAKRSDRYKSKSDVGGPARGRGIRLAKAARFARTMEQSAKLHYNNTNNNNNNDTDTDTDDVRMQDSDNDSGDNHHHYNWPSRLFTALDFEQSWRSVITGGRKGEFFIRLSYQDDTHPFVFEGFHQKCAPEFHDGRYVAFYWKDYHLLEQQQQLKEQMGAEDWSHWPVEAMEKFGNKLSVTIVFYDYDDNDDDDNALHLVIATSGFYSRKNNNRLMLPPRSPLAHIQSAPDLEDCVTVGVRLAMDSKFILLLEWGDYKTM